MKTLDTGDRAEMTHKLHSMAFRMGAEVELLGEWHRAYTECRGDGYPAIEEFLVACPAAPSDKCQHLRNFNNTWAKLTATVQMSLAL